MVSTTGQIKCVKCNAELAPGEKFCGECGQPFERRVAQPEPTTLAGSRKCSRCGASAETNERFCGDCGAAIGPSPRSAQVRASPSSSPTPKHRPVSIVRILLGILLALSLFMGFVSLVAQAVILNYGYWSHRTESAVASTFLVGAAFLFGSCLAMLFPRVYLPYLFPSIAWVLGGLFGLMGVFGQDWGFWPDWIFASGLSNLIGGAIGFVISKIARHFKRDSIVTHENSALKNR